MHTSPTGVNHWTQKLLQNKKKKCLLHIGMKSTLTTPPTIYITKLPTNRLYKDLRRTIHGTVGALRSFIPHTDLQWSLRSFNQDGCESLFQQLRSRAGDNRNMTISEVDAGMSEIRSEGLADAVIMRT